MNPSGVERTRRVALNVSWRTLFVALLAVASTVRCLHVEVTVDFPLTLITTSVDGLSA